MNAPNAPGCSLVRFTRVDHRSRGFCLSKDKGWECCAFPPESSPRLCVSKGPGTLVGQVALSQQGQSASTRETDSSLRRCLRGAGQEVQMGSRAQVHRLTPVLGRVGWDHCPPCGLGTPVGNPSQSSPEKGGRQQGGAASGGHQPRSSEVGARHQKQQSHSAKCAAVSRNWRKVGGARQVRSRVQASRGSHSKQRPGRLRTTKWRFPAVPGRSLDRHGHSLLTVLRLQSSFPRSGWGWGDVCSR